MASTRSTSTPSLPQQVVVQHDRVGQALDQRGIRATNVPDDFARHPGAHEPVEELRAVLLIAVDDQNVRLRRQGDQDLADGDRHGDAAGSRRVPWPLGLGST